MYYPFKKVQIVLAVLVLFLASCSKDLVPTEKPTGQPSVNAFSLTNNTTVALAATQLLTENFETGSKTAYASASVTLPSGSWTLDDALLGTSSSDLKNGSKSVRLRNTGSVTTNFNITGVSGPITVNIYHGLPSHCKI